jgi:hypothetical protein
MDLFAEVVGWIGAVLILGAYAMLTAGKLQAKSVPYQAMNVVGALGFIVNSGWNGAIPSAALNVVWAGIGIVAIAGVLKARRKASQAG